MSDKTVAEKLLIKAGYRVLLVNAPDGYENILKALPQGVKILEKLSKNIDLIQLFVNTLAELEAELIAIKPLLKPDGILWLSYPKKTSKIKADINRDSINAYAKTIGLQGVSMVSIDETWSALRLKIF
jgi:predicted CoA-binding protein